MISPEVLRRYPFFARLDDNQLKAIAMITEELTFDKNENIFKEGDSADALYLLTSGDVDLFCCADDDSKTYQNEYSVGEINVGEPFGISTLMDPFLFTSTARASQPSSALRIQGAGLRAMCELDQRMAYLLMKQIAKAYAERLRFTRIQLVAARG